MSNSDDNFLLDASDCSPVDWANQTAFSTTALVCEHAGNAIPGSLDGLGLSAACLKEHTAIDIGAEGTARNMAATLAAPLLMQRYSRLVIDCNRPVDAADSIPEISHGTFVPANQSLNEQQRNARITEIFTPYDSAVATLLSAPDRRSAFSIHSFTPELNYCKRPWDIGLLFRKDSLTSQQLCSFLNEHYPELTVGMNEPYQIDDESDWFVPQHAERLGLKHSLIEIRNDHVCDTEGQKRMASILAAAIKHVISRDEHGQ